jgi:hypothetical protein
MRPKGSLANLALGRLHRRRPTGRRGLIARAQALAEFTIVLLFLVPIIILITVVMFALYQNWAVHQAETWLGDRIATTGSAYDPANSGTWVDQFTTEVHHFGLVLNPGVDIVTVSVTSAADGSVTNYTLTSPSITANYGDLVQIFYQSPVNVGPLTGYAQGVVGFLVPDSQSPWSGIAQRNGGAGVVGLAQGGSLQGNVSGPSSNLAGAQVSVTSNVASGCSSNSTTVATADSGGNYSFSNLSACDYDVVVSTADYAPSVGTINVISNLTTTANFSLLPAASELVLAGRSGAANLLTNGDFETTNTSGWLSNIGTFTSTPASFAASTGAASWGANGGLVVTDLSSANQGVYQSVAGTFAAGHHYGAFVWFRANADVSATIELGTSADHVTRSTVDILGGWQLLWVVWTPGGNRTGVQMAIRVSGSPAAVVSMKLDEAVLLDGVYTYLNSDGINSDGIHVQMTSGLQPLADSVLGAAGPSSGPQVKGVGAFLFPYVDPAGNPTVQINTPTTLGSYHPSSLAQGQALVLIVPATDPLNYRAAVLTTGGLGGYWRFGESSGTNAADESGNGHSGTISGTVGHGVSGALLTSSDSAFAFDGASGRVGVSGLSESGASLTLEGWVRPTNGYPASETIAGFDNGSSSFLLRLGGSGAAADRPVVVLGASTMVGQTPLALGAWSYLATTYDGSILRLYVNGVLDASLVTSSPGTVSGTFGIGADVPTGGGSASSLFSGDIDEVAISESALSATAVASRYQLAGYTFSAAYPNGVTGVSGLHGFWQLGDSSSSTLVDSSGGGNPLSDGGTLVFGAPGALRNNIDSALTFNGSSGYAVTSGNVLAATDGFTLEGWIKVAGTPGNLELAVYNGDDTAGYGFGVNAAGNLVGYYGSVATLSSGIPVNDGHWHLVDLVRAGGTTRLYLDGAQAGSGTWSNAPFTPIGPLSIGREDATVGRYFAGSIDEVAAYATALSGTAIAARWTDAGYAAWTEAVRQASGIADLWRLGDASGATDLWTLSNAGTSAGGVTTGLAGAIRHDPNFAMGFNGTDGVITDPGTDLTAVDWTLGAWVNTTSCATGRHALIGAQSGGYALELVNTGSGCQLDAVITGVQDATASSGTIGAGSWHFVVATYASSGRSVHYYIDGAAAGTVTFSGSVTAGAMTNSLGGASADSAFLSGLLDEPFVLTATASGATVTALYHGAGY